MLEKLFKLSENKTNVRTELVAGLTTFLTMAYIIFVNPSILAEAKMPFGAVFAATCVAAAIGCFLMAFLANYPIALAPGMGLNGYYANVARVAADGTLVGILTWQQGMAAVFMSGVFYLILTISGLRFLLFKAVPLDLRHAMSAGIGLFICTIGYKIGCILGISYYGGPITSFSAMIPFYSYDIVQIPLTTTAQGRISVLGLAWVALFLTLNVRAGILCAIIVTTFWIRTGKCLIFCLILPNFCQIQL